MISFCLSKLVHQPRILYNVNRSVPTNNLHLPNLIIVQQYATTNRWIVDKETMCPKLVLISPQGKR
jgi:hypothetical protein